MDIYVVKYSGTFGFIKPWSAVRDSGSSSSVTYSQQFLTPSIIEGIRQKLEVEEILRHKLQYSGVSTQLETIQAKAWKKSNKVYTLENSISNRGILLYPILFLAFSNQDDAQKASTQHICLCRNEDILLPDSEIQCMSVQDFDEIPGYELRFTTEGAFMVGYNRFNDNKLMYGRIEATGNPINDCPYELL